MNSQAWVFHVCPFYALEPFSTLLHPLISLRLTCIDCINRITISSHFRLSSASQGGLQKQRKRGECQLLVTPISIVLSPVSLPYK